MKVDIVALLREPATGLAMQIHRHVVIQLTRVEQGGACSYLGIGRSGVLHEPVQHGQGMGQARVVHDRAQVLGGVFRIDEGRKTCHRAHLTGGRDEPTHHLPGTKCPGRYVRGVDPISSHLVSRLPVVPHGTGHLRSIHDAVVQLCRQSPLRGGSDADRDPQIQFLPGHGRRVIRGGDDWPQRRYSGPIGPAGCGMPKIG